MKIENVTRTYIHKKKEKNVKIYITSIRTLPFTLRARYHWPSNLMYLDLWLCLIHGIQIRPVYCFGEGKLFSNIPGCLKTRLKLNRYGIPTILTWGSLFFPLLPKRGVKLYIVVGRPLILPRIVHPNKEEINLWHEKYISELQRIYDEHKMDAYGTKDGKDAELEVW